MYITCIATFSSLCPNLYPSSQSALLPHLASPHPLPPGFLSDLILHTYAEGEGEHDPLEGLKTVRHKLGSGFSFLCN